MFQKESIMNRIQVPIFELKNVTVSYNDRIALKISKFQFHRGTIYGIVGRTGSGKTTLLKVLTGRLVPTEGQVFYEKEPYQKSWLGKVKLPADISVLDEVDRYKGKVRDYFNVNVPERFEEIKQNYFKKPRHSSEWNLLMDELSSGLRYRVHLISVIESDPKVLVIDDYGMNFDTKLKREFNRRILNTVKSRGTTVILSTTEANSLRNFATVIVYLDNGHISKVRSYKS